LATLFSQKTGDFHMHTPPHPANDSGWPYASEPHTNAHHFWRGLFGHILLAIQVILGYVLLGALVTWFAVLIAAGGPAGRFADGRE